MSKKSIDFQNIADVIFEIEDFICNFDSKFKKLSPESRELLSKILDEWAAAKIKDPSAKNLGELINGCASFSKK